MLLNPAFLRHNQTYADNGQIQSPRPIWDQPPIPLGIHDVELSWDRKARPDGAYMRIVIRALSNDPDALVEHPDHFGGMVHPFTWWFKEYLGKAQILGTNNNKGRIMMRAMARINGETLTLYREPYADSHPMIEERYIRQRLDLTHNRLCYRRESQDWRIRDERKDWNDPTALKFVSSYVGDLCAEKAQEDLFGHIFHNGFAIIDTDNVCHLYDDNVRL